jgi:hypothetical protein
MNNVIPDSEIKAILMRNGFNEKMLPDGSTDLHPYVYTAVRAVVDAALRLDSEARADTTNCVRDQLMSWYNQYPKYRSGPAIQEIADAAQSASNRALAATIERIVDRLPADCQPPRPGLAGLLYAVSELARKRADAEAGVDLLQIQLSEVQDNAGQFIRKVCQADPDSEALALELGLLNEVPVTEYCGTGCACAASELDLPGICYRLNGWLK